MRATEKSTDADRHLAVVRLDDVGPRRVFIAVFREGLSEHVCLLQRSGRDRVSFVGRSGKIVGRLAND